jgi:hypothetical protein
MVLRQQPLQILIWLTHERRRDLEERLHGCNTVGVTPEAVSKRIRSTLARFESMGFGSTAPARKA